MRIWLSDPDRVTDLALAFRRAGCAAERLGARTLVIPRHVATTDVRFFVNAWRARHPALGVRLTTPESCPRWRARRRTALHPHAL